MNQLDIDLARRLAAERESQVRAEQERRLRTPPAATGTRPTIRAVLARVIAGRLVARRRLG